VYFEIISSFYNVDILYELIVPLIGFRSSFTSMDLGEGFFIEQITDEERNHITDLGAIRNDRFPMRRCYPKKILA
jgi:hypothetical protein